MIVLVSLLAAAAPAPCQDAQAVLQAVVQRGEEQAYLCIAGEQALLNPLLEAIKAADPDARARLTRALTLHLAARSEVLWDPAHVRLLNAADRRLLADAVKARQGRRSPSPQHDAIFKKQSWYLTRDTYTDGLLSDVAKANILMANHPQPPPSAPTAAPVPLPARQGCGCSVGGTTLGWLGVFVLFKTRRSRAPAAIRGAALRSGS